MALKKLYDFEWFDLEEFLKDKELEYLGKKPWTDYHSDEVYGERGELVIISDNTKYRPSKDGSIETNLYEKLIVKVRGKINIPLNSRVIIEGGEAKVYGDPRVHLSIKADAIKPVQAKVKL